MGLGAEFCYCTKSAALQSCLSLQLSCQAGRRGRTVFTIASLPARYFRCLIWRFYILALRKLSPWPWLKEGFPRILAETVPFEDSRRLLTTGTAQRGVDVGPTRLRLHGVLIQSARPWKFDLLSTPRLWWSSRQGSDTSVGACDCREPIPTPISRSSCQLPVMAKRLRACRRSGAGRLYWKQGRRKSCSIPSPFTPTPQPAIVTTS